MFSYSKSPSCQCEGRGWVFHSGFSHGFWAVQKLVVRPVYFITPCTCSDFTFHQAVELARIDNSMFNGDKGVLINKFNIDASLIPFGRYITPISTLGSKYTIDKNYYTDLVGLPNIDNLDYIVGPVEETYA